MFTPPLSPPSISAITWSVILAKETVHFPNFLFLVKISYNKDLMAFRTSGCPPRKLVPKAMRPYSAVSLAGQPEADQCQLHFPNWKGKGELIPQGQMKQCHTLSNGQREAHTPTSTSALKTSTNTGPPGSTLATETHLQYRMISLICGIKKKNLVDTENRLVVARVG